MEERLSAIMEERGEIYGNAVITHVDIAQIWTGLLADKLKQDISAEEVALMFVTFKALRAAKTARSGLARDDNYDDMHNYATIAQNCSAAEQEGHRYA